MANAITSRSVYRVSLSIPQKADSNLSIPSHSVCTDKKRAVERKTNKFNWEPT